MKTLRLRILALGCLAVGLLPTARARAQEPPPLRLTLEQAVERGWRANLRSLLAEEEVSQAEATRLRARALLLPKVFGETSASLQNRSLRAFGISGPGIPTVVGPFSLYDFRLSARQPLLDLTALHLDRASRHQEAATRLSLLDARDLVTRIVSGLYLNAQAAEARVEAARARVETAQSLFALAQARREEGVATGVDVLRAQVSLANERQRLLELENQARQATILLARSIGTGLSSPIELAEPLALVEQTVPDPALAVEQALSLRADYLALESRRRAVAEEIRSIDAKKYPRAGIQANYGALGRNLGEVDRTGTVQGSISITLFDPDRQGEKAQAESRLRVLEHQAADLRLQIEQEVRIASLDLESAAAQVEVAGEGQELARRELELARTRFETGVTNNIEVITAQESLARAQENLILALSRHADARAALRRALGGEPPMPSL